MKTQSAKAKGRRFQQWVRDKLIETLGVEIAKLCLKEKKVINASIK